MAGNVVSLSFKNNLEEINLYNYLKTKSSPSAYIKELIKKDLGEQDAYIKNAKVPVVVAEVKQVEEVAKPKLSNLASIYK